MIFNELDRSVATTLCTLAMLTREMKNAEDIIVQVGQNLGVSREETLMIIDDWDEMDVIVFSNDRERMNFLSKYLTKSGFTHN